MTGKHKSLDGVFQEGSFSFANNVEEVMVMGMYRAGNETHRRFAFGSAFRETQCSFVGFVFLCIFMFFLSWLVKGCEVLRTSPFLLPRRLSGG